MPEAIVVLHIIAEGESLALGWFNFGLTSRTRSAVNASNTVDAVPLALVLVFD
jgi:hypothetical protein